MTFSPLPFSIELNIAIRKVADRLFPCGFDVGPDAPETLEALTDHIATTGRMLVSDQHCENNIFGCATEMTIKCHDTDQFIETIEQLVHKGLGFEASKLTGEAQ